MLRCLSKEQQSSTNRPFLCFVRSCCSQGSLFHFFRLSFRWCRPFCVEGSLSKEPHSGERAGWLQRRKKREKKGSASGRERNSWLKRLSFFLSHFRFNLSSTEICITKKKGVWINGERKSAQVRDQQWSFVRGLCWNDDWSLSRNGLLVRKENSAPRSGSQKHLDNVISIFPLGWST